MAAVCATKLPPYSLQLYEVLPAGALFCSRGLPLGRKSLRTSRGIVRIIAGRKNDNPRKFQQPKDWLSSAAPMKIGTVGGAPPKRSLVPQKTVEKEDFSLNEDQAIGQVITAQANFMRVIVQRAGYGSLDEELSGTRSGSELRHHETREEKLLLGKSEQSNFEPESLKVLDKNAYGNEVELLCVVRNVLKKIGRRVLVGDKVLITGIDWREKRGMIEDVIDRRSEILDPPVANVNNLLLVFSIDQPRIDDKVLSRFLVEAESTEIPFSLVLNKVDLVEPEIISFWQDRLAVWGYDVVLCSADFRIGLSSLTRLLRNKITVVLGPSGVGKSSLINALRDEEGSVLWNHVDEGLVSAVDTAEASLKQSIDTAFEGLPVGEVSVGSGKGRHTTRHVSLLNVPGGSGRLADTPGFSQPSLAEVTKTSLSRCFPEIERRIVGSKGGCAFHNCLHVGEPFCVVGEDWDRHSHYLALLDEIQNREKVQKRVLGTKRESEVRYRVTTDGVKQAEPMLLLKKYRRASRKQTNQSLEDDFQEEEKLQADIEDAAQAELI